MTNKELDALAELAKAATPGTWVSPDVVLELIDEVKQWRRDVPELGRLLEEVKRLRAVVMNKHLADPKL